MSDTIGPTLSPIERSRLADAAALVRSGESLLWDATGLRLSYRTGRAHPVVVYTAGTHKVHTALCDQARAEMFRLLYGKGENE